jgi:hypothetical protein
VLPGAAQIGVLGGSHAGSSALSPLQHSPINAVFAQSGLHIWALGANGKLGHMKLDSNSWFSSSSWQVENGSFSNVASPLSRQGPHSKFEVFAPAADGNVLHQVEQDGWFSNSHWDSIGRTVIGPITVCQIPNRIDLVSYGPDRQAVHKALEHDRWLPSKDSWEPLGGTTASPHEVVSWGPGHLDITGLGPDKQIWHKWREGTGWGPSQTDWECLGGQSDFGCAAVTWGPKRVDLVVVGTDHQMWHKCFNEIHWEPGVRDWNAIGGNFISRPAIVSRAFGQFDIFCLGSDYQVHCKSWSNNQWQPSTGWMPLGGSFVSAPRAVASGEQLHVFAIGRDEQIYHMDWSSRQWRSLGRFT